MKSGKAVAVNNNPFTIRLKYDTPDITGSLYYGEDSGRENIGVGVSDEKKNCVFLSELDTNNKSIKIKMKQRADHRSNRHHNKRVSKQRKAVKNNTTIKNGKDDIVRTTHQCKSKDVSYPGMEKAITHKVIQGAEAQFNNRKRQKGSLPPSGNQLIQMHLNMLKQTRKILPITHVTLERVCFDFQKLENENIAKWEYGKGPLYGFKDYKDYIYQMQDGKCLLCGCDHIDHYHHIDPRKKGGNENVKNIAGLCKKCHVGATGVHNSQETQDRLVELKGEVCHKYSIGLLNSVMPKLIEVFQAYCDENDLIFNITNGYDTCDTRTALNLSDDHCIDGYCISLAGRELPKAEDVYMPDIIHQQQRFKKKSNNNINALNQREYYYKENLVAINRHKRTDQKEDSLEEYMSKYAETHTKKECDRHFHDLKIKPAKRTYTYHKKCEISPFHPGDTIKYEKKNKIKGNTKRAIFVATSIVITGQKVCYGNNKKNKKIKFCKRIGSGSTPFVNKRKCLL